VAKINFQNLTKVLINCNTVTQIRLFQNVITDMLHNPCKHNPWTTKLNIKMALIKKINKTVISIN